MFSSAHIYARFSLFFSHLHLVNSIDFMETIVSRMSSKSTYFFVSSNQVLPTNKNLHMNTEFELHLMQISKSNEKQSFQ